MKNSEKADTKKTEKESEKQKKLSEALRSNLSRRKKAKDK